MPRARGADGNQKSSRQIIGTVLAGGPKDDKYAIFEDNYANGEGDLHGNSLKQVLSQTGERADHLVDMITSYEEIPPLFYYLPQGMATRQGTCVLGPTTKATFRDPLIRPDSSLAGAQLLKKIEDRLGFEFGHDYEEFMHYCNIA